LLQAILVIVFGALLIGLIMYLCDRAPFISPDAKVVVHWVLLVVLAIYVVWGLAGLLGIAPPLFPSPHPHRL